MSKTVEPPETKEASANNGNEDNKGIPLQVTLVQGDIKRLKAPVIVVGHYKGVAPIHAVGAIDRAMDYWISEAGNRGMLAGDLGTLFFIPVFNNERVAAQAVLLGGMGEYGKFDYFGLCYMVMNISFGISEMQLDTFGSVVIGAGDGGLSLEQAVKGLLSGICDGLHHQEPRRRSLKQFILAELNPERYQEILKTLHRFKEQNLIEHLDIEVREGDAKDFLAPEPPPKPESEETRGQPSFEGPPPASKFVNKITIAQGNAGFEFTAMMDTAVVPVRRVRIQPFFTEGIADRLRKSGSLKDQEKFGQLLHMYVFPQDFEKMIAAKKRQIRNTQQQGEVTRTPLTLILDNTTASLPWEMACLKDPESNEDVYFGRDLQLSRQFRTTLSGSPGIAPPVNRSLSVLIIADPAHEKELRLEEAQNEGNAVKKLFESFQKDYKDKIDITVESFIGPDECNPIEIIRLLYDKTYDILHYTGHGIYNSAEPDLSGWVFGQSCILSAREIFRARRVARLVFANACFTSVVTSDRRIRMGKKYKPEMEKTSKGRMRARGGSYDWRPAEETNRSLAGLAEAFFERGVENYIGAGWRVYDDSAMAFAKFFYNKVMQGEFLGDALAGARNEIFDDDSSSWGAYQHYGQPNTRMVPPTLKKR